MISDISPNKIEWDHVNPPKVIASKAALEKFKPETLNLELSPASPILSRKATAGTPSHNAKEEHLRLIEKEIFKDFQS